MHAHLRSLSLRGRLIILGGGATAVLLVLALASTLLMSSFRTLAHTNASREEQARTLSHAYESWIYNDDQNNMYVAVMALKAPSKLKVAERTWQQSLAAYHESESQLSKLRGEVRDPAMLVQLSAIQANLALYNGFSRQMRAAAVAGNVDKSVYIATEANLKPSDALPVEFSNLRNAIENKETQSTASVRSSASTGTTLILLVAGIGLPLLLLLVWTTIRSIMSGVGHVKERVDALSHAMVENLRPGLSALANGDFTHRLSARTKPEEITRHDELGQIMRTTEHMREAILECGRRSARRRTVDRCCGHAGKRRDSRRAHRRPLGAVENRVGSQGCVDGRSPARRRIGQPAPDFCPCPLPRRIGNSSRNL